MRYTIHLLFSLFLAVLSCGVTVAQDEETRTPVFCELGLRLAYEFHLYKHYALELSGGVKNVLDSFQRDPDRGPNRDANYIYGPSQPRTYFLGLSLKI